MVCIKIAILGAIIASATADYDGSSVSSSYGIPSSSGGDYHGGGDYSGAVSSYSHQGGGYSNGFDGYSGGGGAGYGGYASGGGYDGGHSSGGHEHHEAKPYEFGYAVKDPHHGTDFGQQETSDGHNVKGSYRVALPDGRTQIVTYHADWKNGFHADVKYEGEAHYPEQSAGGYHSGGAGHGGYQYGAPQQQVHSDYTTAEFGGHSTGGYHSGGGYRR